MNDFSVLHASALSDPTLRVCVVYCFIAVVAPWGFSFTVIEQKFIGQVTSKLAKLHHNKKHFRLTHFFHIYFGIYCIFQSFTIWMHYHFWKLSQWLFHTSSPSFSGNLHFSHCWRRSCSQRQHPPCGRQGHICEWGTPSLSHTSSSQIIVC